ncbi:FAD-dependent oxidoreductase [Candidatus Omnitrophota bacterium]
MESSKNIIIGAGISGLSCGWALKDCLVLEKDFFIGGLCKTVDFGGYRFDLGGHRFFTKNKLTEDFVRSILSDELLEVRRISRIYKDRRLIDYPLKASVIFCLNPLDVLGCFFSYILRKLIPLPETSFEEAAKNRFGDRLYGLFFKAYTRKVWGLSCRELSEELVRTRMQDVSLRRVVVHAVLSNHKAIKSFTDIFLYPERGIGALPERLSEGLDIRTNSKVTGFIRSDDKIDKVIINGSQELEAESVVSTMPITNLVRLLDPPEEIQRASDSLKYRSLICVFLTLNKNSYTDNHWVYFPDNQIFGRLHEPKNWSLYMAPKERTGICVEIFCDRQDDIWRMAGAEIAHQVIRDLPFLEKFEVEDHFVEKVDHAYPVYDINYRSNLVKVKKFLSSYKNLFLLGRTGAFRYINMDTCVEQGLRLGNILRERQKERAKGPKALETII